MDLESSDQRCYRSAHCDGDSEAKVVQPVMTERIVQWICQNRDRRSIVQSLMWLSRAFRQEITEGSLGLEVVRSLSSFI